MAQNGQTQTQTQAPAQVPSQTQREYVKLNEDLFHFLILYTLKYPSSDHPYIQNVGAILFAALVFCIQFICMYALSYTYVYHWGKEFVSSTYYVASGDNIQLSVVINGLVYAVTGNITSTDTIDHVPAQYTKHFDNSQLGDVYIWSAIAGLLVFACYLLQSLNFYMSSMWALLHFDDRQMYDRAERKLHYALSLLLIWLSIAFTCSCWLFATFIIFYGVYFDILATSDILLVPIGAVFVLEIDDWAYSWFVKNHVESGHQLNFWKIEVNYGEYSSSVWRLTLSFAVFFFAWVFAWATVNHSVYLESGINYLFSTYLVILIFCVVVCWPVSFIRCNSRACGCASREVFLEVLNFVFLVASPLLFLLLNIAWEVQTMDPDTDVDAWYARLYGLNGVVDIDEAKNGWIAITVLTVLALVCVVVDLVILIFCLCKNQLTIDAIVLKRVRIGAAVVSQLLTVIAALVFVSVGRGFEEQLYGAGIVLFSLVWSPTALILNVVDWKRLCLSRAMD